VSDDRERPAGIFVRPDPDRRARAEHKLRERGWSMTEFIDACLGLVDANPDRFLRRLSDFRHVRRRGRPRKST
jgi:hypothetical protein